MSQAVVSFCRISYRKQQLSVIMDSQVTGHLVRSRSSFWLGPETHGWSDSSTLTLAHSHVGDTGAAPSAVGAKRTSLLLLCPLEEMDVSFRTESPHSSFTFTHVKCCHVCFCFCETGFVALTWDARTNNAMVLELRSSSYRGRGSLTHDDSWCPGGCFLVHHRWAKWKQKHASGLNGDSWKWPYRDPLRLLHTFHDECFQTESPVTTGVVENSIKVSLPPQTWLKENKNY